MGRADAWLRSVLDVEAVDIGSTLTAPAQAHTPLVLPFFSGERSTGWVSEARAVLSGVSAATSASSLYRGTMEGVAVSYARIALGTCPACCSCSPTLQIPVDPVLAKRSTLRGTAVIALQVLAPDVLREPLPGEPTQLPRAPEAAYYTALRSRFASLYAVAVPPRADVPHGVARAVCRGSRPLDGRASAVIRVGDPPNEGTPRPVDDWEGVGQDSFRQAGPTDRPSPGTGGCWWSKPGTAWPW